MIRPQSEAKTEVKHTEGTAEVKNDFVIVVGSDDLALCAFTGNSGEKDRSNALELARRWNAFPEQSQLIADLAAMLKSYAGSVGPDPALAALIARAEGGRA